MYIKINKFVNHDTRITFFGLNLSSLTALDFSSLTYSPYGKPPGRAASMTPLARLYHKAKPPGLYSAEVLSRLPSGRGLKMMLLVALLRVAVEIVGHIYSWPREEDRKDTTKAHARRLLGSNMTETRVLHTHVIGLSTVRENMQGM